MIKLSIEAFRQLYEGTGEFAVIDPREELIFSRAHLFAATNLPLSRLELDIRRAVPDVTTKIVLCDDGEGTAERAEILLSDMGYRSLCILDGGLPAWALSGGAVFAGMNVPSKAFGEVVERDLRTPTIDAAALRDMMEGDAKLLLIDARPRTEHEEYCIPGSISCPSAELIFRTADMVIEADTQIVVHCAGRTRSIVGAQTLIDAGIFKNVVSLHNGTPGWEFEGLQTEKGSQRFLPTPKESVTDIAQQVARRIRVDWSIADVSALELRAWRDQPGTRYVIDVRSEDEYLIGHIEGAKHVAGGQLLQTTDRHLVVRNAHVALVDSDGVRAVTTAMWLRRMGWRNVVTCTLQPGDRNLVAGLQQPTSDEFSDLIDVRTAADMSSDGSALICDLRRSFSYRRGHAAGAIYLTRAEPDRDFPRLPARIDILLMADDRALAGLVCRDLTARGHKVFLIDGTMKEWMAADLPVEMGTGQLVSRPIDTYFEADHFEDQAICDRENHAYLNWEIALIDHIVGEPAARFDLRPVAYRQS